LQNGWKKIVGITVEQSLNKRCITNILFGTEDKSDLDCPDLKSDLVDSVEPECATACISEEDRE
jgi:hypothetical protein